MRHRKHRFQLGRKSEHRVALMANLAQAIIRHDQIQTTLPKAKALRPFVEKIITLAKKASKAETPAQKLHYRRLALARVRDREAIKMLFDEKVEQFIERDGGYTRIYKLGQRVGDAAEMALICFISADDEGYGKKRKKPAKQETAEVKEEAVVEEKTAEVEVTEETNAESVAEAAEELKEESAEEKKED